MRGKIVVEMPICTKCGEAMPIKVDTGGMPLQFVRSVKVLTKETLPKFRLVPEGVCRECEAAAKK